MAGKTGADAIFRGLHHICIVLRKYDAKLRTLIANAVTASVITSSQATFINSFLDQMNTACTIFQLLADFNSPF